MSSLIEEIFGNSRNLTKEQLEKCLIGEDENLELEFKTIWEKQSKKERKTTIIDPLLGFLNSSTGNGVLCLGVATKKNSKTAERIDGVNNQLEPCISRTQLSSTIKSNIGSVPPYTDNFRLDIIEIDIGDNKSVFLLEIERVDKYCVYYSKVNGVSRIRVDDEDKELSMEKFYDLVAKRTYAKLSINVNPVDHGDKVILNINYRNDGFKPGKNVYSIFIGCTDKDYEFTQGDITYIRQGINFCQEILKEFGILDEIKEFGDIKVFATRPSRSGKFLLHPDLVYPNHTTPNARGIIGLNTSEEFKFVLFALIFEEKSLSFQKMTINRTNENISIEQNDFKFKPYISG